jgi:hypothetical protein
MKHEAWEIPKCGWSYNWKSENHTVRMFYYSRGFQTKVVKEISLYPGVTLGISIRH